MHGSQDAIVWLGAWPVRAFLNGIPLLEMVMVKRIAVAVYAFVLRQ